jgi:hypothetical protein
MVQIGELRGGDPGAHATGGGIECHPPVRVWRTPVGEPVVDYPYTAQLVVQGMTCLGSDCEGI